MFLIKGNRLILNGNKLALCSKKSDNRYYTDEYTNYKYMTIVALEDDLTVQVSRDIQYCVDCDENWITLTANTPTQSIKSGQTLSFKCNTTTFGGVFSGINKNCNLSGNCMSLLYGDDTNPDNTLSQASFQGLFSNCTTIKNVSKNFLPCVNLNTACYVGMFANCTSLVTAPELPAATLKMSCYFSMFANCTSLVTAPELPAATLVDNCYNQMFMNCSSLNYIKMLATNNISIGSSLWV